MNAPLIQLTNVKQRKGDFCLEVDNLELMPAKLYALTGPNGAGKSSLLRLLALLERADSGVICFDGAELGSEGLRHAARNQITMVEQEPYFFHGTVMQNICYGLKLRGLPQKEQSRRADEALERVALSRFATRAVDGLSSGEARRVAVARAIALKGRLLLLDEPTANVDQETQPYFAELIQQLLNDQTTVLFSTHDASLQQRVGAKLFTIDAGRLAGVSTL
ncbi:MAG: energy-coupling factor ABC transporter ATP-binding protein [Desulfuromonadales bacterium]|nr:energy-coupling factor ABC transporter ATP-binding protein [Desulfuromonadales bacterium]